MVGAGELQRVRVELIELDRSNPRIQKFLEFYKDPTPDQMYLALGSASDDLEASSASFEKLRNSILTNGGIIQPIIVNRLPDGRLRCIEGNTRVALYKEFAAKGAKGNWEEIPALVYDDMDQPRIDAIRLQVHMVGTRPWGPYAKAKYLHSLRTHDLLPFSAIIDFCGGKQKEIQTSINAFEDMETYYRPLVGDENFDMRMFSGFVELQDRKIKETLLEAKFSIGDFASWVHEEKFRPLQLIRSLPSILKNTKARELFLKHNAKKALDVLTPTENSDALKDATVLQLVSELKHRLYDLPWHEAERLKNDPAAEDAQALQQTVSLIHQILGMSATED